MSLLAGDETESQNNPIPPLTLKLNHSFDNNVFNSITMRRKSAFETSNSFLYQASNGLNERIFDQFLILGLPHNAEGTNPTPKILFVYPAGPPLLGENEYNQLPVFCFPHGFMDVNSLNQIKNNAKIYSQTNLIAQFVFTINGLNNTKIYGVSMLVSAEQFPNIFFVDEQSKKYPFCFLFLLKNPMIAPSFAYLTFLFLWFSNKIKCIIHDKYMEKIDIVEEKNAAHISDLVFSRSSLKRPEIKIPRFFLRELAFYYDHTINQVEKQHILIGPYSAIYVPPAIKNTTLVNILYPSLSELFSALSVDNIIKLYTLILLEAHIVIQSYDVHKLSLSVLAASELAYPFELNVTVLPILPKGSEYLPLLDSPVPYIIGLLKTETGYNIPKDTVIVDLDKNTITNPNNLPSFPMAKKLKSDIKSVLSKYKSDIIVPSKKKKVGLIKSQNQLNPQFLEFFKKHGKTSCPVYYINLYTPKYVFTEEVVDLLFDIFTEALAPFTESLIWACLVTDTTDINNVITIFNKDLFMASIDPTMKSFFTEFLNTTVFERFSDGKIREKEASVANTAKRSSRKKRRGNNEFIERAMID